jgi:hypothetical protein
MLETALDGRRQFRSSCNIDANELAPSALVLEFYDTFDQSEESVVLAPPHIFAGLPFCSTLTGENVSAEHVLAAELLQSKPLSCRIPTVSR